MRQNQSQNQKRSRGRGRRNNNNFNYSNLSRNSTIESNGPDGRVRGNAQQLFEKYTALALDANAASERVSAEAFSQFADHYYRLNQTIIHNAEQQKKIYEDKFKKNSSINSVNGSESDKEIINIKSDNKEQSTKPETKHSSPESDLKSPKKEE